METQKKEIDALKIQLMIIDNLIPAGDLYREAGNMNVLLTDDVENWLEYAPYISNASQLLHEFTASDITEEGKAALFEEMKPLSKVVRYTMENKCENQELTYYNAAFEILENKRVKVDQISKDEQVIPAHLLLPAAENRDLLQIDLGYDLSRYGLPRLRKEDPEGYYNLIEVMGPANSFDESESIIPLEVLDDVLRILEQVICNDFRLALDAFKGQKSEWVADLDKSFASWRVKYPILQNMKPNEFHSVLLQHYVQPASRIIHMLGNKVLCRPYENESNVKIIQTKPWTRG